MQFKKIYFIHILIFCFGSLMSEAQFMGGNSYNISSDHYGDACSFLTFTPFAGGDESGFSNDRFGEGCNFITYSPFVGGMTDGFSNDHFGDTCNSITYSPFIGGGEDGSTSSTFFIENMELCNLDPLPIELLYFDAIKERDSVRTEWVTLSERDNDYFTIERSLNGYNWSNIGEVVGAGNSSSQLNYHWYDTEPEIGMLYYRLKQTDYNGKFTHSETKTLLFKNDKNHFTLYPNPTKGTINLVVNEGVLDNAMMKVYSSSGQFVFQVDDFSGTSYSFDLSNYQRGVYILKINSADNAKILKIVKQ